MKIKFPPVHTHALIACLLCSFVSVKIHAQTASVDFENGSFSPCWVEVTPGNISEIVTPSGFSARAGTKVHRIKWFADNYDGTRPTKSVEGTSSSFTRITSDGWYGFSFYLPDSFPATGKEMELAQIHAWHTSLPATNAMIGVTLKPDGKVYLSGGYGVGDGGKVETAAAVISHGLAKGAWHDMVIYCKLSRINTGILRAWIDGAPESAPTVSVGGINLGNGAWSGDELMTHGAYIKWGPYCWDTGHYTAGESRELFYDEIAYQVGNPVGAFDLVKPTGYGAGYAAPAAGAAVMVETFDTMTAGSPPTGMTLVNESGTTLTVRDIPSTTDKCIQFSDSSAATHAEATKTFPAQTDRFTAGFSMLQSGTADGHFISLLSGTTSVIELRTVGGNLVYRDGSAVDHVVQAVPAGMWYDIDIDINPKTFKADVYVGGSRKLSSVTFRRAATSVDRIRFGTSDASATYDFNVNDITIALPPVTMNETFDAFGANATPRYWSVKSTTNTSALVSLTPSATDKSIKLTDTNSAGKVRVSRGFIGQPDSFTAEWSFMQSIQADGHRMALDNGFTQTGVELVTSAGQLMYKNSSGTNVAVQAIPPNTWYEVRVVVRPTTSQADVYVNNVLKLSNQSLRLAVTRLDRVAFETGDALAAGDLYIDNVRVNATAVPPPAPLAAGVPRLPIMLKLDDLSTGGGNVPNDWRRLTNFTEGRQIKIAVGLIAQSLASGNASYISYITGLNAGGRAEFWFHGYDHIGQEFSGPSYADQKNRFVTSQSLAQTKLGFKFKAFGAPENAFDSTTVQVMSEDPDIKVWLYGNPSTPAGKSVLERVSAVNIESPTFVPNLEKFISGYLANYAAHDNFVIQGHPNSWTHARWVEFVRLIDWLQANGFTFTTPSLPSEVIVDNADSTGVTVTGAWASSTYTAGYYGSDYLHDSNTGQGTKSVRFTPTLPVAGSYEVFARWSADANRASNVPVDITHSGGSTTVTVNQRVNGGQWKSIGIYSFAAGTTGNVLIRNTGTNGNVIADAVKFVKTPPTDIIMDNADSTGVTITGAWGSSTNTAGYYGSNYLHDSNAGQGTKSVRFTPTIPVTGGYEVFARWVSDPNRATNAPIDIIHSGGSTTVTVNQRVSGGQWVSLGVYDFDAGTPGSVLVSNTGANGYVIADAVRLVRQ